MDGYPRRRRSFFFDFDEDELEAEFDGEPVALNPFSTTYYLGRGRFGDNSRLHRGWMIIRERGFSPSGFRRFRSPIRRDRSGRGFSGRGRSR